MFFVVESQKLVNSVVVNVEKERKKERLLEGVKNIANTCKYHVLEAGEDEKQRKYRVVEVEKVKKLGEKTCLCGGKVVAVRFPAGPSAEG